MVLVDADKLNESTLVSVYDETPKDYLTCRDDAARRVLALLDGVSYQSAKEILERAEKMLVDSCFIDKRKGVINLP